jgi:hypothetical protein
MAKKMPPHLLPRPPLPASDGHVADWVSVDHAAIQQLLAQAPALRWTTTPTSPFVYNLDDDGVQFVRHLDWLCVRARASQQATCQAALLSSDKARRSRTSEVRVRIQMAICGYCVYALVEAATRIVDAGVRLSLELEALCDALRLTLNPSQEAIDPQLADQLAALFRLSNWEDRYRFCTAVGLLLFPHVESQGLRQVPL